LEVQNNDHSDHSDLVARIIGFTRSMPTIPPDALAQLSADTNIVRDLRLDSVAVMEYILELEIAFDTIIPLDNIADIETIGDLARVISAKPVLV
jgi:acyl carrier protein